MFDIGFWELLLISIIGLVVLGPERLPVAIRTVSGWIKNIKAFSQSVKSEISQELRIQELHADLKKAEQANFEDLSPQVAESLKSLKEAAKSVQNPYEDKAIDESNTTETPAAKEETNTNDTKK